MTATLDRGIDLMAIHRLLTEDAPLPELDWPELQYAAHVLVQDGHSSKAISERLGVAKRTIDRWRASRAGAPLEQPADDPYWQQYARCAEVDAGLFFPPEENPANHSYTRARAICATCPVRAVCLEDAMGREGNASAEGRAGMWGGLSPDRRAALSRARRPQEAAA